MSTWALWVCVVGSFVSAPLASQPHQSQSPLTVAEVVKQTSNAVVQIVTFDASGKAAALGSGFLVSPDGKIVTNYHVIEGADSAVAKLADGSYFPVEGVLAAETGKDLVLLKVDGHGLPFLALASTAGLQVGDPVVAIGSPLGLGGTVSNGIVSALRSEGPAGDWIQTTAPVSHGNSGGPLLDMRGSVIGVITWGVNLQQGQNLNFAIPSDVVKSLLAKPAALSSIGSVGKSKQLGIEHPGSESSGASEAAPTEQNGSQTTNSEQRSMEQLRAIAEAIKECPKKVYEMPAEVASPMASLGFIQTYGPPTNVVWSIGPGDSVLTPFVGTIEYVFPDSDMPPDEDTLCNRNKRNKERERCRFAWGVYWQRYEHDEANPWQFKYEFTLTPDGLESPRSFSKQRQTEGEPWVPGRTEPCGRRAVYLVLGSE